VLFIVRAEYRVLRCVIYCACGVPGNPLCYLLCVWSTGYPVVLFIVRVEYRVLRCLITWTKFFQTVGKWKMFNGIQLLYQLLYIFIKFIH